jgi:hypothetical protein
MLYTYGVVVSVRCSVIENIEVYTLGDLMSDIYVWCSGQGEVQFD